METTKGIRLLLDYANENGDSSTKELTVRINTPIWKDKDVVVRIARRVYSLSFSIALPEHIHSYLKGKTVPVYGMSRSSETYTFEDNFKKTITYETIEKLTDSWNTIINQYVWLKRSEKMELKKVIFYSFANESRQKKSSQNSMRLTDESAIRFQQANGYVFEDGDKIMRYNEDKKMVPYQEYEFQKLKYIEWTPERETFFKNISKTFENIIGQFTEFDSIIGEHSIDAIITNGSVGIMRLE